MAALTLDAITLAPTLAVLALAALAYLAYLWTSPKAFCAGEVTAIYIYPLKSARGISVKSATLDERGLEFDRLWMAVDDYGTFLSQRRAPKLALIEVSLPKADADPLELRAPGARPLSVPVVHEVANTPTVSVRCWDDQCDAVDQGDEAAAWLATVLGVRGVRLVRMAKAHRRTRPQDEGGPVPYHLRFHDLQLCEDFPSFDIVRAGAPPSVQKGLLHSS